jgi:hypothetical protein
MGFIILQEVQMPTDEQYFPGHLYMINLNDLRKAPST